MSEQNNDRKNTYIVSISNLFPVLILVNFTGKSSLQILMITCFLVKV